MSAFGDRLKAERLRLGLSQDDFASAGGVARNAQGHYESGHRSPSAEYLLLVATLGVDLTYVMTGHRAVQTLSTEESALLDNYASATKDGKRAARSVLLTLTQQDASTSSSRKKTA